MHRCAFRVFVPPSAYLYGWSGLITAAFVDKLNGINDPVRGVDGASLKSIALATAVVVDENGERRGRGMITAASIQNPDRFDTIADIELWFQNRQFFT